MATCVSPLEDLPVGSPPLPVADSPPPISGQHYSHPRNSPSVERGGMAGPAIDIASQLGNFIAQYGRVMLPLPIQSVADQIGSLACGGEYETPPTNYAQFIAEQIILSAYLALVPKHYESRGSSWESPPAPIMGVDDNGGILVSWTAKGRYLAANFGGSQALRSFIYREEGQHHKSFPLEESTLREQLEWLTQR